MEQQLEPVNSKEMEDNPLCRQILKLFWPVFIANIGVFTMSLVDSLMLSHSSAKHLGLQSIGDMPITIVLMLVNGLVQGTLFTVAEAFGREDFEKVGAIFRNSLKFALLLSLVAIPLFIFAPQILSLLNYPPEQSLAAAKVMKILSISIPFALIYFVCMFFLNGIKRPWIATRLIIVANLINFFLNWLLIEGHWGFPALYSAGVATSTTIVRIFLSLSLLSIILFSQEFKKFKILHGHIKTSATAQQMLGISATANLISFEVGIAFCLFYAGYLDLLYAAAFTLSYRLIALMHLVSTSLAVAASVLISPQRENYPFIQPINTTSFKINNMIVVPICIIGTIITPYLAKILSNDAALQELMLLYLPFTFATIYFRCTNSLQIILLRTVHDLLLPSLLYFVAFTIIQPLFGYLVGNWHQGSGLIFSLMSANFIAVVFLGTCFYLRKQNYQVKNKQ